MKYLFWVSACCCAVHLTLAVNSFVIDPGVALVGFIRQKTNEKGYRISATNVWVNERTQNVGLVLI